MGYFSDIKARIAEKSRSSRDEFLWFLLGQFSILISNFIVVRMLTKTGKDEFGFYTIVITVSALLSYIYYGPVQQAFMKFYFMAEADGEKSVFTRLMSRFILFSSVGVAVTGITAAAVLPWVTGFGFLLLFISALFITSARFTEFFNSAFNILRQRKTNSILQFTEKLMLTLLIILLTATGELSITSALFLMASLNITFALIKNHIFRKNIPEDTNLQVYKAGAARHIKRISSYSMPFIIWGVSGWLQLNSEKWILANLLSLENVGVYGVMAVIVNMFVAIPANILSEFISPVVFANYSDPCNQERVKKGKLYVMITFFSVVIIAGISVIVSSLLGEWIIRLFSSSDYAGYYYLLPVFVFGAGLFNAGQALTMEGLALNKPGIYLAPKLLSGAAALGANYFFINTYGLPGAAYSVLFAGAFYMLYVVFVNSRLRK